MAGITLAQLEIRQLEKAKSRLGEAVLDPGQWPSLMEAICTAAATTGAALLQSDVRTSDVPVTPSVVEPFRHYFDNNLHVEIFVRSRAHRCCCPAGKPSAIRIYFHPKASCSGTRFMQPGPILD